MDFLFALVGVFIHFQNFEDEVFVLDVALRHEFLEAFPVLGCEVGGEVLEFGEFVFLELVVHVRTCVLFAFFGKLFVEGVCTVGRCIGLDVDFVELESRVTDCRGNLFAELIHGIGIEFAGADVGLVDEEHDVGGILLIDDALESIGADGGVNCRGIGHGGGFLQKLYKPIYINHNFYLLVNSLLLFFSSKFVLGILVFHHFLLLFL